MKKVFYLSTLAAFVVFLSALYLSRISPREKTRDLSIYVNRMASWGDLDGDGDSERVLMVFKDDEYFEFMQDVDFEGYIAAYNKDGTEIARTPEGLPILWLFAIDAPIPEKLVSSSAKDYLRVTEIAGAHHFNDIFFEMVGDKLLPVCKTETPGSKEDCVFNNSSYDKNPLRDIDGDGYMEMSEIVDEYPPTGGRGRPVLASVYSFNGKFFEPQTGDSYEKYYNLIIDKVFPDLDLMNRIDWGPDSAENSEKIRRYWQGDFTE